MNPANKIRRIERHTKKFPKDESAKRNLALVRDGKAGQKADFKAVPKNIDAGFKRDGRMEQPTREDYRKLSPLYLVHSMPERVCLTATPFYSEALKAFTNTQTRSVLEQRVGDNITTLRVKA
jgi:hypothetical protein